MLYSLAILDKFACELIISDNIAFYYDFSGLPFIKVEQIRSSTFCWVLSKCSFFLIDLVLVMFCN